MRDLRADRQVMCQALIAQSLYSISHIRNGTSQMRVELIKPGSVVFEVILMPFEYRDLVVRDRDQGRTIDILAKRGTVAPDILTSNV